MTYQTKVENVTPGVLPRSSQGANIDARSPGSGSNFYEYLYGQGEEGCKLAEEAKKRNTALAKNLDRIPYFKQVSRHSLEKTRNNQEPVLKKNEYYSYNNKGECPEQRLFPV